ncbi:MAG TPA: VOC family protein [Acidobacteriota bacterium]|nr:VOC family protein [Acidobacteriota bacterium]HQM64378.1 VOC family protein [Acidobacteriota bacterium]
MPRVTGIGGIFFKAKDPAALREWYRRHLGLDIQGWGGTVFHGTEAAGTTVWNIFEAGSNYFDPSHTPFMINYRVADLDAVLAALRAEGCAVDDRTEESAFGKFGWVMDPEGHRIELWQPPPGGIPG